MTLQRRTGLLALSTLLWLGCSDPVSSGVAAVVTTDRPSYTVGEPIVATLTNTGRTELVLPRCGERVAVAVDRRVGSAWVEHSGHATACPAIYLMVPLDLAPGEAVEETLVVEEPGTFRFRFIRTSGERMEGFASSPIEIGAL